MITTPGTLTLRPEPASVGMARRHVAEQLAASGDDLDELLDTAKLLVSEVVTNAVLHAATAITVSCRFERGAVRIEVEDGSPIAPTVRHYADGASTGRGLGLVELLAADWGVEHHGQGKTVWFLLVGPPSPLDGVYVPAPPRAANPPDMFTVVLSNLPVRLVSTGIEYGDGVLRELALVAIGDDHHGDRGPSWRAPAIDLGPLLAIVEAADRDGQANVDVALDFPRHCGSAAFERLALIEEADQLAREGRLLTMPAVPEVGACRQWLLSQIGLQDEGKPAVPWVLPEPLDPVVRAGQLSREVRDELNLGTDAVLVADDGNRIIYANAGAADLLGWAIADLIDRRLITIIPIDQRETHLAGFTRHLLTGERRLIGRSVQVPALRRDGSTVLLEMTLRCIDLGGGRQAFRADFSSPGRDGPE